MNSTGTEHRPGDDHIDLTGHTTTPPPPSEASSRVFTSWRTGDPVATTPTHEPSDETPDDGAPTNPPKEEYPMATTKRQRAARTRKSSNGSPQLALCQALLQHGDLARDALKEQLPDITGPQFASALNNAKAQGRVAWIEKDQVLRLTKAGTEWAQAATEPEAPAAAARKPREKKAGSTHRRKAKRTKAAKEVDTSPTSGDEPSFRCAVMSDGAFFLSKGDAVIELDADEPRQMLAYLERMAVEA